MGESDPSDPKKVDFERPGRLRLRGLPLRGFIIGLEEPPMSSRPLRLGIFVEGLPPPLPPDDREKELFKDGTRAGEPPPDEENAPVPLESPEESDGLKAPEKALELDKGAAGSFFSSLGTDEAGFPAAAGTFMTTPDLSLGGLCNTSSGVRRAGCIGEKGASKGCAGAGSEERSGETARTGSSEGLPTKTHTDTKTYYFLLNY